MSDVHIGIEGWLFLIGGSNKVLGQFDGSSAGLAEIKAWKEVIKERYIHCKSINAKYFTFVAPEKLTVYDNKLDNLKVNLENSLYNKLSKNLLINSYIQKSFIRSLKAFRENRDVENLYQKTDTHWTPAGCLIAYNLICSACGARSRTDFKQRSFYDEYSPGDLGVKLVPPSAELRRFYNFEKNSKRIYANTIALDYENGICSSSGGTHIIYENNSSGADPRRLVLFGDSYSNFKSASLLVMLAETFKEVHFVWSPVIDWAYVTKIRPDILVAEIAERFLCQSASDSYTVLP